MQSLNKSEPELLILTVVRLFNSTGSTIICHYTTVTICKPVDFLHRHHQLMAPESTKLYKELLVYHLCKKHTQSATKSHCICSSILKLFACTDRSAVNIFVAACITALAGIRMSTRPPGVWMQDGASAFILDLRDNSGGVVGSGYSIAQLLLRDGDGFCIVRFGTGEEEVVKMQETSHVVTQPLASTSRSCSPMLSLDHLLHPVSLLAICLALSLSRPYACTLAA